MSTQLLARHKRKHLIVKDPLDKIRENIKLDKIEFEESKQIGEALKIEILNKTIDPTSLRSEYLKKVNLESGNMDSGTVELKIWQQKLLERMMPSPRTIIWVVGTKGEEGKSWFQQHLLERIGSFKVFSTAIDRRADGILHALSKRQLPLIDVFLFNVPRCFPIKKFPYTLLEDIKDGRSLSSKYDSKQLTFKTPNIVIVFSNRQPVKASMSADRWMLFNIQKDDLTSPPTLVKPQRTNFGKRRSDSYSDNSDS